MDEQYLIYHWFFLIFHLIIIFFNLFGWIWKKTLKANLALLSVTGFSWFILGIWHGIGYCPITDWHYQILYKAGIKDIPHSFIEYIIELLLPVDISAKSAEILTFGAYIFALIMSIYRNLKARKIKA